MQPGLLLLTANKTNLHFLLPSIVTSIHSMVVFFFYVLNYTLYGSLPGLPPLPARRLRTRRPLRDPGDGSRSKVGSEVFEPDPVTSVCIDKVNIILHSTK